MKTVEVPVAPRPIRFGVFELDRRAGELRKDGLKVRLQDKPLRLLEALLETPGEVVTREELRQRLWPADTFVDFDNSLNNAVNKVRTALRDSGDSPRFVETVGRRGYRFIALAPAEVAEAAPPTVPVAPVAGSQDVARPPSRRTPVFALAGVSLLLLLLAALVWRNRWSERTGPGGPGTIQSLAVLPIENLSGDPSQEYFADGMTDALITELASLRSLRVISRQSVMRYKRAARPLPEIARELNVDAVVEGSVLRDKGRVRLTAQLVHAPSDRHLWARSYERDVDDVLSLQGELAQSIAREIRVTVTPQERARLARRRAVHPEAYDAYLRGRFFWNKRDEQGLTRAIEYFDWAIERDPGFALAHAGLADCYGAMGYFGLLAPEVAGPRTKAAALRAMELDDSLVEALTALAASKAFYEWDWRGAEGEFQRAIELNPNYSTAHLWYGLYLGSMGRLAEAFAAHKRALALDPVSATINSSVAYNYYLGGHLDQALEQYRKALELNPDLFWAHQGVGSIYEQEGRYEEGLYAFQKAAALSAGSAFAKGMLGRAYAVLGRKAEARQTLEELMAMSKQRYLPPLAVAYVHVGLGEKDDAFVWLEKSYRARCPRLSRIKVDPLLASLRTDPRFQDLLRRMNL